MPAAGTDGTAGVDARRLSAGRRSHGVSVAQSVLTEIEVECCRGRRTEPTDWNDTVSIPVETGTQTLVSCTAI